MGVKDGSVDCHHQRYARIPICSLRNGWKHRWASLVMTGQHGKMFLALDSGETSDTQVGGMLMLSGQQRKALVYTHIYIYVSYYIYIYDMLTSSNPT